MARLERQVAITMTTDEWMTAMEALDEVSGIVGRQDPHVAAIAAVLNPNGDD